MADMLPIWIGLGFFSFLPFLALGAFIRPVWVPLGIAVVSPAIWIWGLGIDGYLAGAIGGAIGALVGAWIGPALRERRARIDAQRRDSSPGGTT